MKFINKKTTIILITILVVGIGSFLLWKSTSDNETQLDEVLLRGNDNSDMFAIMVENSDGEYELFDSDVWPQKENGYLFNEEKSGCMDAQGNTISGNEMQWRNNIIKLKTKDAAYCYLYFDIVSDGDFCIDQGITNLGDCLLVMEDYSYNKEAAIDYINDKGSATTSAVAPTVTYVEKVSSESNSNGLISTVAHFTFGSSYTFNSTTGIYTLKNYVNDTISDDYIDYYTCGGSTTTSTTCTTMYKIKAYSITTSTSTTSQKITEADVYTYSAADSFDSEVGLYKTTDSDGDTYFYRGAAKNNYVSYGGFIWRVVRINGNGTVRMIYSGTSTSATGADTSIGTSAYNSKYWDPTYVGYKYGEDLVERETTDLATYYNLQDSYVYYFGKGYVATSDGKFQLDQDQDMISGKWSEVYEEALASYPYTCVSTSKTGKCNFVLHLQEYVNANQAKVYYISNNSKDYASTLTNTTDSTIKTKIDTWYEENIKDKTDESGNLLSDYLSDEVFCNDRSIYSGTGYLLSSHTYYGAYNRVASKRVPSLICSQDSDKFSVANGNLTYPIALLTADEASLAGGKTGNVNTMYYLYTGQTYWTMSPSYFAASYARANVWSVYSTGNLSANLTAYASGVRPVINLSSDVLISQGTGTADNPFVVTLQ